TVEAELERAFTAGGLGFAATSWAHARPSITAFAERWTVIREQACRETKLEGRRSEAALARIESCLDEQRATVAGLLETWRGANQAVVTRAPLAAAGLEDPGLCLDELALARRPLPDEAQARAQVQVLRTRIERAQLKERAGEVGGAQREIDAILAEAEALGWVPLQAEADLAHGRILSAQNGFAAARAEEERAFERAMATGHDLIALRASIGLISLIGYHGADAKVGLGWARLAAALLERLALMDSVDAGDYQRALGDLHWSSGDYERSADHYRRAVETFVGVLGPEHPRVAETLRDLGYVYMDQGDQTRARETLERAQAIQEAALGADHPDLLATRRFMAKVIGKSGDLPRAIAMQRELLAAYESALGVDALEAGEAALDLGTSLAESGSLEEALVMDWRALKIIVAEVGPDRPLTAIAYNDMAVIEMRLGRNEKALGHLRQALAIHEALDPDHPNVASAHHNIASALRALGRMEEARVESQQALALFEAKLGVDHPNLITVLLGLGEAELALGALDDAGAHLERALTLAQGADPAYAWRIPIIRAFISATADGGRLRPQSRAEVEALIERIEIEGGEALIFLPRLRALLLLSGSESDPGAPR
ncbi:MAG: tetratricopeptide repeat protein, partial [Myxococcales bacterium]|nr:tetratricopeptide repeat protein [Myxococcales bacterium]